MVSEDCRFVFWCFFSPCLFTIQRQFALVDELIWSLLILWHRIGFRRRIYLNDLQSARLALVVKINVVQSLAFVRATVLLFNARISKRHVQAAKSQIS